MQELMTVGTNVATLIAILAAVITTIVVAYAGIQYATAAGDPQKVGQAKNGFIGAFIGLIIASLAFIGPRVVTELVIEPVGEVAPETELNCDGILRNQLVFQRGASTADRMDVVIAHIQARHTECAADVWDPRAIDMGAADDSAGTIAAGTGQCFESGGGFTTAGAATRVGDQDMPPSLLRGQDSTKRYPRTTSGRDSGNNIIVYWHKDVPKRPSDAASCWLYYTRLNSWHANFVQ